MLRHILLILALVRQWDLKESKISLYKELVGTLFQK